MNRPLPSLGFSQLYVAKNDPLVEQVLPDLAIPPLPVWLTTHQAIRNTPRIRQVWDMLERGIKPFIS